MKCLIFSILMIFCGLSVAASQDWNWTPSDAGIAEVEASIKLDQLPYWKISNLPSLAGYERYYAGSRNERGEKLIFGELIAPLNSKSKPGIHMVARKSDFPVIYDGGCAIINLVYSLKEQKIISIECNGRG